LPHSCVPRGERLTVDDSTSKNPDDIVITLAIRTPLTKAKKGGFKDVQLDGLVFKLLEQVVQVSLSSSLALATAADIRPEIKPRPCTGRGYLSG
jgi:hypothetical protein